MAYYWWILIVISYLILGLIHLGVRRILIGKYYIKNWNGSNDACGDGENFWIWFFWFISFIYIFVKIFIELLTEIFYWVSCGFGKYKD